MGYEFDDIYLSGSYQQIMGTGNLARQWAHIHRKMEKPFRTSNFESILEVGAGNAEHIKFVQSGWDTYFLTDLRVEPLVAEYQEDASVVIEAQDVQALTYADDFFDRIIVTCVLAHVAEPFRALEEIKRVARPGAKITIYLPCEPGIFLRLARSLFTMPKNRRLGVKDPYLLHFREHIHYYPALNHYLNFVFSEAKIKTSYYPFKFLSWNFNLYKIYQIS